MEMLEIERERKLLPVMPGTVLHVLAWGPKEGKLVPTERPTALVFPILAWRDNGVGVEPVVGAPLGLSLADALDALEAVDYCAAVESAGTIHEYRVPRNLFTGVSHATAGEWQESNGNKDPMAGLAKKDWDKAVKANREAPNPLILELRRMGTVAVTVPMPTPKPMQPTPLPAERPIPEVPGAVPGTIPGPGMTTETPEEIAEARRNMEALREGGFALTEPATGLPESDEHDDEDAASLV